MTCGLAHKSQADLGLDPDPKLMACVHGEQVFGPGVELRMILMRYEAPDCNCDERIKAMEEWGVEGCNDNFDTIVNWLMEAANNRYRWLKYIPLTQLFLRNKFRKLVRIAINNAANMQAQRKSNR